MMTSWCAGASSWCSLLSKRCRIFLRKLAPPHTRPTVPQTEGRWCEHPLVWVSPGLSTCRWAEQGRFQWKRGGCCLCRSHRPLPVALMQKMSKITRRDEERNSEQQRIGIFVFFFFLAFLCLFKAYLWEAVKNYLADFFR